nr:DgaE family pyridoxal phosphate-dependent ammonia lyase [Kroppenstedtia pulmonis]
MNFKRLGLRRVINASGRMSVLGASTLADSVVDAMGQGGQQYIEMADLMKKGGDYAAEWLGVERALIVNCAAGGIALTVAGLIAKDDPRAIDKLYEVAKEESHEFVILKGHNVDFGAPVETMVHLGGGQLKEAGYANGCRVEQLEAAITGKTVAVLYVKSHHCVQKNMPSLEQVKAVCRQYNLPLVVDAAAEEDFSKYPELADIVIYSGAKAIAGPTSGIVAGKKEFVQYVEKQLTGVGRAMKVGKETIFGLLQALENHRKQTPSLESQRSLLKKLETLNGVEGVKVVIQHDEAGRPIIRGRVYIQPPVTYSAKEVTEQLKSGEVAVYTRDYEADAGYFDIDPRPLQDGEMEIIVGKLQQILSVTS